MKRNTLIKVICMVLVSLFVVSLASCSIGGDNTDEEMYTIYLDPNGGVLPSNESDEFEVVAGSSLGKLPTPTRSGYEFLGWFEDGIERYPIDRRSKADYDEMLLKALWKAKENMVLVEFLVSGDEQLVGDIKYIEIEGGQRLSSSTEIKDLPQATLADHKFMGWKDAEGNVVSMTTKVTSDIVLTPIWEKIVYCLDGTEAHNWMAWQDSNEATCTDPGRAERLCDICGHKEYNVIQEALGHKWSDWAVTTSQDEGMVLSRSCKECQDAQTNKVKNIAFSNFNTPIVDGTGWGMNKGGNLTNQNYTDKDIAGNGTGAITVTMEAKEAVYVDIFAVTGFGTASYFIEVFYDDGTSETLAKPGSFGSGDTATKAFDINRVVTKFVVTMPACSNGTDYWSELSALIIPQL